MEEFIFQEMLCRMLNRDYLGKLRYNRGGKRTIYSSLV